MESAGGQHTIGGLKGDLLKWLESLWGASCQWVFTTRHFTAPGGFFPFHERIIRQIAGLGQINRGSSGHG